MTEQKNQRSESLVHTSELNDTGVSFEVSYTANIPSLLQALNITIALTSYQAQRLVLIRSTADSIDVDFTHFPRPMGLAVKNDSIVLGTFNEIVRLQREDVLVEQMKKPLLKMEDDSTVKKIADEEEQLANQRAMQNEALPDALKPTEEELKAFEEKSAAWKEYQEKLYEPVNEQVDACFIARSSHYSGMINIHDVAWGNEGLWVVNSTFSCLCTINPNFSFVPKWKPHFIDELSPHDLCHLNGMAMKDGEPAYVTSFSTHNEVNAWRESLETNQGTLMCVKTNRILLEGLDLPHSPRCYRDKVYFCESSKGLVSSYDPETGERTTVAELPGFTRGMAFYGSLMFVGLSRLRKSSVVMAKSALEKYEQTYSGIWIINLEDNNEVGKIVFDGSFSQIYDVGIIEESCFPEIIQPDHPRMRNHFCYSELTS
jgi:uncharacterized protein (TIGR03032 family)